MPVPAKDPADATAIRPFTIPAVPEAELEALRGRITAARWPEQETVGDDSQGVPLQMIQELAGYWATDYDWRPCEAKLHALPHFLTEIDGLDIHFILLYARRRAYAAMMGTRPQTLYGLADSPVGLAAWLLDHGDGWGQPAAPVTSAVLGHAVRGYPAGDLTRDDVLDNITLYWLTSTAVSSARLYWENKLGLYNAADVSVPAAVSAFPGENYQAPRSWTERAYHRLIYYHQPEQGGHFAAWEQPQIFSAEVRAGLRPLRS